MIWVQWILASLMVSFFVGLMAPVAGVGGGIIYAPLLYAFFPFDPLIVSAHSAVATLGTSLGATNELTRRGVANVRMAITMGTAAGMGALLGAIAGSYAGASALGKELLRVILSIIVLGVVIIMLKSKGTEFPEVRHLDRFSKSLGFNGAYYDVADRKEITYETTHTIAGSAGIVGSGFVSGMFGLGSGWANVPIINLVMKSPIRVATSTSVIIIALAGSVSSLTWFSLGFVIPLLALAAFIGRFIGAVLGSRLALRVKSKNVRYIFICVLLFASVWAIWRSMVDMGWI